MTPSGSERCQLALLTWQVNDGTVVFSGHVTVSPGGSIRVRGKFLSRLLGPKVWIADTDFPIAAPNPAEDPPSEPCEETCPECHHGVGHSDCYCGLAECPCGVTFSEYKFENALLQREREGRLKAEGERDEAVLKLDQAIQALYGRAPNQAVRDAFLAEVDRFVRHIRAEAERERGT